LGFALAFFLAGLSFAFFGMCPPVRRATRRVRAPAVYTTIGYVVVVSAIISRAVLLMQLVPPVDDLRK
jgi:hypothetical protein